MSSCSIAGTSWSDDELHTPSENSVEPVLKTVVNPMATEMVESSAEGSDDELDIIYSVGHEGDVYWRQAIEVRTRDTIGDKEHCVYTTNPEAIGDFVLAHFLDGTFLETATIWTGDGKKKKRKAKEAAPKAAAAKVQKKNATAAAKARAKTPAAKKALKAAIKRKAKKDAVTDGEGSEIDEGDDENCEEEERPRVHEPVLASTGEDKVHLKLMFFEGQIVETCGLSNEDYNEKIAVVKAVLGDRIEVGLLTIFEDEMPKEIRVLRDKVAMFLLPEKKHVL